MTAKMNDEKPTEYVQHESLAAALAESKATGVAAAPGISRVRPGGALRVVPDKNAGEAVERLVRAGVITWDGRPVLEQGAEREKAS